MGCGRTLREFWATVEAQEHHRLLATKVSTWLLPNSPIRLSWDIFIFTAICYTSLVTPVRMFIMSGDSTPSSLIHVDVAFDFVFAIDTILHWSGEHLAIWDVVVTTANDGWDVFDRKC